MVVVRHFSFGMLVCHCFLSFLLQSRKNTLVEHTYKKPSKCAHFNAFSSHKKIIIIICAFFHSVLKFLTIETESTDKHVQMFLLFTFRFFAMHRYTT